MVAHMLELSPFTRCADSLGAYTWKCRVCGFVNQGMVDAPL